MRSRPAARARRAAPSPRTTRLAGRLSDADLLAGLRFYARVHRLPPRRAFTISAFNAWPARPFRADTVINRFGSWKDALARIGIPDAPPRRHDSAALIAEYERLWREIGRPPGCAVLRRRSRFAPEVYTRRWGSLKALARLITLHRQGRLSRERLLNPDPPPAARTHIPIRLRWQVLRRDRFRCTLCGHSPAKLPHGAPDSPDTELHIDHITPVARGGPTTPANLRTLCRNCNLGRGRAA